jgi:hypothetical protein
MNTEEEYTESQEYRESEYFRRKRQKYNSAIGMQSLFAGAVASRYLIDKFKEKKQLKITPMKELDAAIKDIRKNNSWEKSPLLIMNYLANNIDRLLYQEKYLIIDTYDEANTDLLSIIDTTKKTKGQIFYENNFINL